jgi:acyl carrier protein
MNASVKNKINHLLNRHFLVPAALLQQKRYLEDLGLSKLEQKEMLNLIEAEFKIQVSEQDEIKIKTVNDTVNILDKYLAFNKSFSIR